MDRSRVKRFTDEHPDLGFPWHEALSTETSTEILARLDSQRSSKGDGVFIPGIEPDAADFSLENFLGQHRIVPQELVYLNYFEGTLDRMRFVDLARYFDEIFWPGPDDLQIFDDTFSWSMFIDHDRRVHLKTR